MCSAIRLGDSTASFAFSSKFRLLQPEISHFTSVLTTLAYQRRNFLSLVSNMPDVPTLSTDSSITKVPHVLTVAGSDSGAGAGIQADLKACAARGVYCSTVITAVTAQNTRGVQGVNIVPEEFVEKQLRSVLSDMHVDVMKTGMLPSAAMVIALRNALREFPVKALVVDPVMVSTSGDTLSGPKTISSFRDILLPLADILTPNVREASSLLNGVPIQTIADMHTAAKLLHAMGPRNVLVKGGDLPDSEFAVDVFFDGDSFHELRSPRVRTRNTHGTGCTLAACISAEIAKGASFLSAVKEAKGYIESVLDYSKDLTIGEGSQRPFAHFLNLGSQRLFQPDCLFLYAVTDSGFNKKWKRSMVDAVRDAIEGGATIIQLREKEAGTGEMVETAMECRRICKEKGVPFVVNDRVDVALACDADGVHLGQSDMTALAARRLLGPSKIIGVSCKTEEQAARAYEDGADYVGCGGVYPTSTKENNVTVGLDGLRKVCLASRLPVVAIGGINGSNAGEALRSGVGSLRGVAVVSALFNADDVKEQTRMLRQLLLKAKSFSN